MFIRLGWYKLVNFDESSRITQKLTIPTTYLAFGDSINVSMHVVILAFGNTQRVVGHFPLVAGHINVYAQFFCTWTYGLMVTWWSHMDAVIIMECCNYKSLHVLRKVLQKHYETQALHGTHFYTRAEPEFGQQFEFPWGLCPCPPFQAMAKFRELQVRSVATCLSIAWPWWNLCWVQAGKCCRPTMKYFLSQWPLTERFTEDSAGHVSGTKTSSILWWTKSNDLVSQKFLVFEVSPLIWTNLTDFNPYSRPAVL